MEEKGVFSLRFPNLPDRIRGLERLAYNLWWSWHRPAREMFRALDVQAWINSGNNPLKMLSLVTPDTLQKSASDPDFVERYDAVMAHFEAEVSSGAGWFAAEYGKTSAPLAYFSAE